MGPSSGTASVGDEPVLPRLAAELGLGMVPGVSEAMDVGRAGMAAREGSIGGTLGNLAMAGVGAVPVVGDVARQLLRVPTTAADVAVMNNPKFLNWFGTSRLRTPEQYPMRAAHGTAVRQGVVGTGGPLASRADDFEAFRLPDDGAGQLGIHVAVNPRQTDNFNSYSSPGLFHLLSGGLVPHDEMLKMGEGAVKTHGRTLPLYGRAENPLRLADRGSWSGRSLRQSMQEMTPDLLRDLGGEGALSQMSEPAIRANLKGRGFDSIVYRNRYEGVPNWVAEQMNNRFRQLGQRAQNELGSYRGMPEQEWLDVWPDMPDSYIMLNPNQLKSAIGNDGNFRRTTNDLLRALALSLGGGAAAGSALSPDSVPPEG